MEEATCGWCEKDHPFAKVLEEHDGWSAGTMDASPGDASPGPVVVIPKRHVSSLAQLPVAEMAEVLAALTRLSRQVRKPGLSIEVRPRLMGPAVHGLPEGEGALASPAVASPAGAGHIVFELVVVDAGMAGGDDVIAASA
ncbi:MAG TPA: hypothetical protein VFN61_09405 [Acidimicrobiales bacterium]|nr:hypothetical protein [Acidimicrobiales bacterium]